MKKILFSLLLVLLFLIPLQSNAGVNLPWSSSYPTAWSGTPNPAPFPFEAGGAGVLDGKYKECIMSAANYPGGGGGCGQRHYFADALNIHTGGLQLSFNSNTLTEIYIRFYMRIEPGVTVAFKVFYLMGNDNGGAGYLVGGNKYNQLDWRAQLGNGLAYKANVNWTTGVWHCIEVRLKSETGPGTNDGILQMWFDGSLVKNISNADLGLNSDNRKIKRILIGSNHEAFNNGRVVYVDFDDVVVSTSYIGPTIGPTAPVSPAPLPPKDTTPPAPPQGLKMQ